MENFFLVNRIRCDRIEKVKKRKREIMRKKIENQHQDVTEMSEMNETQKKISSPLQYKVN